ncbi:disease resistance protein Roq1 [Cryptomeria japonica]|uniref:disease resistance protein Roq1 n=1 Tax=Cryptomeria japonica TaxID=3369 RepID=UPI0027DAA7B5|nr:disease resistance protein Roq1 [Cryptomeria japonica]
MASSSWSGLHSEEPRHLSVIEPSQGSRLVEECPKEYDVFINHRGPDVKTTLALQLYNSLQDLDAQVFLDSEEKEIGCSFPSTITTAIRSATVHIAIFSPKYAESVWCLEELVLMLQTTAMIIPVFYDGVQPSDLRHVEAGKYADAFVTHTQKGRCNGEQLEAWKNALKNESLTAGFESSKYKNDSDLCESIVVEVKKELERKAPEYVAEHSVGLDKLVEDFERFYQKRKEEGQANILGIVGMGGIGKSTLAREFFNRRRSEYHGACFLANVREASKMGKLPSLQCKLLKDLLRKDHREFGCKEDGISYLMKRFKSVDKRFLIVLDDIDHLDQLQAFPILKNLGNSLAIVTTRDEGVLRNAQISIRYKLKVMTQEHGSELFCWHAFEQRHPADGYREVVKDFIDVSRGLPLYLRVLGRHIRGRNPNDCQWVLNKYKGLLHGDIKDSLKISLETLDREEENVFMDMACFFVDKSKSVAIRVWEGSGWNAHYALGKLKEKGIVEEIEYRWNKEPVLTMHDLLRDLGRERATEVKTQRLWSPDNLRDLESMGFQKILDSRDSPNWRCFQSIVDSSMGAEITYFLANSDGLIPKPASLLWLELDFNRRQWECIPPWIPLKKLQFLKIMNGDLKRLWQSDAQASSSLKELQLYQTIFVEGPDLLGKSNDLEGPDLLGKSNDLEKILVSVDNMTIEGWSFLESLILNPKCLVLGPSKLSVELASCRSGEPAISSIYNFSNVRVRGILDLNNRGQSLPVQCPMCSLQKLEIFDQHLVTKVLVSGFHYPNIKSLVLTSMEGLIELDLKMVSSLNNLELTNCKNLKIVSGISGLPNLVTLNINRCSILEELPCLDHLTVLQTVTIGRCEKLNRLELHRCENLQSVALSFMKNLVTLDLKRVTALNSLLLNDCQNCKSVSGISDLANLVTLNINQCSELEELPCLAHLSCLQMVTIGRCEKLNCLAFADCKNLKTVEMCFLPKLVEFSIRLCPELEKLPHLVGLSCLQRIIIDGCGNLKSLELRFLNNLKSLKGIADLTELEITKCPELQELPNLACLEKLTIKLQDISGIEELPALKNMQLLLCSNAVIRNLTHRLQRVPSEYMAAIGIAVDGAKSTLRSHLLSDWVGDDAVIQINIQENDLEDKLKLILQHSLLSAIIVCTVVVVDSATAPEFIQIGPNPGPYQRLGRGEWIVVTAITDQELIRHYLENFKCLHLKTLLNRSTIEKVCMVTVKKGEESKTLALVKMIVDRLLKK